MQDSKKSLTLEEQIQHSLKDFQRLKLSLMKSEMVSLQDSKNNMVKPNSSPPQEEPSSTSRILPIHMSVHSIK